MRIYLKEAFLFFLLLLPGMIFAQAERTVIVQGTVTAESDGESLIAVNVYEVNPTNRVVNGTVTDFNGPDGVKVKDPVNNKLVFSYMGFKSHTVAIGRKSTINIKLEDDSILLNVSVVTSQRRICDGIFCVPQR